MPWICVAIPSPPPLAAWARERVRVVKPDAEPLRSAAAARRPAPRAAPAGAAVREPSEPSANDFSQPMRRPAQRIGPEGAPLRRPAPPAASSCSGAQTRVDAHRRGARLPASGR